jgi:NADH:ubiquinone oxidoreductase 24 kD subunit
MNLITALKALQDRYGYLPADELRAFSQRTSIPLYQVQAVASFYPHFRLRPGPRLEVKVCTDLSCHLGGARQLRWVAEQQAATLAGYEVGTVSCLGRCDQAPAVAINDTIYAGVNEQRLGELLVAFHQGQAPDNTLVQQGSSSFVLDPYAQETERFAVLRTVLSNRDATAVIQVLKAAACAAVGRGGISVAGVKWEIVRNRPEAKRSM